MSSYSDAYSDANQSNGRSSSSDFVEYRLKRICFDQLNPTPHKSYLDRHERTIFFGCLILLIVYWRLLSLSYPMVNDIYSKDEYFRRELQVEQENIRQQKKDFEQLLEDSKQQCDLNDPSCRRCCWLLSRIDIRQVFRILDNQQHVKQEYDEHLLPVQSMLILLCLVNNALIIFIFPNAIQLFLLSNVLLLLCLGIYAEFFIQDQPSSFYTLSIAVFILLFAMFLLFQVLKTFIIIRHYQLMRKTLRNVQSEDLPS